MGCGTGQATLPFIEKGYQIKAIELSSEMSRYVESKFSHFNNFMVETTSFENAKIKEESIDLLYSATAFHWIDEQLGYEKIRQILKKNGRVALFWNHPFVASEKDSLHQRIQKIYTKYGELGARKNRKQVQIQETSCEKLCRKLQKCGFRNVEYKIYKQTRRFSAEEYICLLNTYSTHRRMELLERKQFENEIKKVIVEHGNILNVYDTMDLYLATK